MAWMKWENKWINMKMFNSLAIENIGSVWAITAYIQSDDVTLIDNLILESGFDSEEEAQRYLDSRMQDML